ncbi:MAG: sigma-54-dependent Fis family transcriptional regulator [Deltaproteobacteria bacterium]|nr:sigma-54-dependent Fis family transcriptional regulator [Deltaproteobacteria bacterium]
MSGGEQPEVLIVEDEPHLQELIFDLLAAEGCRGVKVATVGEARSHLSHQHPDLLLLDVKLPDGDGLSFLAELKAQGSRIPAVVITAFGTVERAVQALQAGATDFLIKPFEAERFRAAVAHALEAGRRLSELELRTGGVAETPGLGLVGADGGLRDVVAVLHKVADLDTTVLILGESGTGKQLVARALHDHSRRRDAPFVAIDCSAMSATLLESELYGFERGAFTGAHAMKKGLIETAEGGTLFLDEIGDMPLEAQSRLLRVLQEREITRVGGRAPIKVDVRVIAATHRDLSARVKDGLFRHDLLYRLNVVPLHLPPLRERRQDLFGLLEHFLARHAERHRVPAPRLDELVRAALLVHPWPGNVRELINFAERAVVLGRFDLSALEGPRAPRPPEPGPEVASQGGGEPEGPAPRPGAAPLGIRTLREAVAGAEREAVIAALNHARGNKAEAARILGISYKTLFNKIHEHGIKEGHRYE